MSRETSFVAIERRETPVLGDVKLRRVPIAVTTGWGGVRPARVLAQRPHRSAGLLLGTRTRCCAHSNTGCRNRCASHAPARSAEPGLIASWTARRGTFRTATRRDAADARPCRSATRRRVVGPDARVGRCHRARTDRARGCAPRCDGRRGPEGVGNSARDRLAGGSRAAVSGGMAFTRGESQTVAGSRPGPAAGRRPLDRRGSSASPRGDGVKRHAAGLPTVAHAAGRRERRSVNARSR